MLTNNYNPKITDYINKAPAFAQPILKHLRELIHKTSPNIQEAIKWSHPHFDYNGGPICFMPAFKTKVTFGFWNEELIFDPKKLSKQAIAAKEKIGTLITVADLPGDEILIECLKAAMAVKDAGIKLPRVRRVKPLLVIPDYFTQALKKNKTAEKIFSGLPPSHKREYVEWIAEAKTDETRNKRIAETLALLSDGKSLNWKYQR